MGINNKKNNRFQKLGDDILSKLVGGIAIVYDEQSNSQQGQKFLKNSSIIDINKKLTYL